MSGYSTRDDRREVNKWLGLGVGWWIVLLILALVVSAAVWGVRVLVSEPKGQGDAIIQKNSAENWTAAQARFEDLFAEYDTTLVKIDNYVGQVAAKPDDVNLTTELNGLRSYCASVAADYNAEARKFLSEDFRAVDLPASLDAGTCNK